MMSLFKEPLIQLVLGGIVLFGAYHLVKDPRTADGDLIRIEMDDLALYLQSRAPQSSLGDIEAAIRTGDTKIVTEWVNQYVYEQVLVREARALDLDRIDRGINGRLARQMRLLLSRLDPAEPSAQDLVAYYDLHKADYQEPATASFEHLFFQHSSGDDQLALQRTLDAKASLSAGHRSPGEIGSDRFPYHRAYVDRSFDYVAEHFGTPAAQRIFALPPSPSEWAGPISTRDGYHLVRITAKSPGRIPPLEDIRDLVAADLAAEINRKTIDQKLASLLGSYRVELDPSLRTTGSTSR